MAESSLLAVDLAGRDKPQSLQDVREVNEALLLFRPHDVFELSVEGRNFPRVHVDLGLLGEVARVHVGAIVHAPRVRSIHPCGRHLLRHVH